MAGWRTVTPSAVTMATKYGSPDDSAVVNNYYCALENDESSLSNVARPQSRFSSLGRPQQHATGDDNCQSDIHSPRGEPNSCTTNTKGEYGRDSRINNTRCYDKCKIMNSTCHSSNQSPSSSSITETSSYQITSTTLSPIPQSSTTLSPTPPPSYSSTTTPHPRLTAATHYGTRPGRFETSKIHFPTSEGVSKVSDQVNK